MATPAATQLQDDRFLFLETLGRGGMASVYRAFDRIGQRVVALKVQTEARPGGPQHPFATEFDAWSRLSHPNVVHALELARARSGPLRRDTPYLVLEHVRGGPADRILRPGREHPAAVQAFAVQVLRGLDHVHRAGFVHRDLKPSNILVGHGPEESRPIKLTDFGLATPLHQAEEPGRVSGSLPYVAPEALYGCRLDERADLYGLGILLFLLTTGELPLRDNDPAAWVRWHLTGDPPDPARAGWRGPRRLARFIRRLTERDREGRPADSGQALALLEHGTATTEYSEARPACSRSCRARLRLALDAVRRGAVRVLRGPEATRERAAFWREAAVSAQVLGLGYFQLSGLPEEPTGLEGVALGLLAGCGSDQADVVRQFDLHRSLRLVRLGDLPVLDRTRCIPGGDDSGDDGRGALTRFVLHRAARQALALRITGEAARADARVASLAAQLCRTALARDPPRPGRGGLLLLLD